MYWYSKRSASAQRGSDHTLIACSVCSAVCARWRLFAAWANIGNPYCGTGAAPNIHRGGGQCSCSGRYYENGLYYCPNVQCSSGSGITLGIHWTYTSDTVLSVGGCIAPFTNRNTCQQASYPYQIRTYAADTCPWDNSTGNFGGFGCRTTGYTQHNGLVGWNPSNEPCYIE